MPLLLFFLNLLMIETNFFSQPCGICTRSNDLFVLSFVENSSPVHFTSDEDRDPSRFHVTRTDPASSHGPETTISFELKRSIESSSDRSDLSGAIKVQLSSEFGAGVGVG